MFICFVTVENCFRKPELIALCKPILARYKAKAQVGSWAKVEENLPELISAISSGTYDTDCMHDVKVCRQL
jgi:hypothetical protein